MFELAAALGVVLVLALVSYLGAVSDGAISTTKLIVHNAIGVPAMIWAIAFLVAGLVIPNSTVRLGSPT